MSTRTRNIIIGVAVAAVILIILAVLFGWLGSRVMHGFRPGVLIPHRSGLFPFRMPFFGIGMFLMPVFWLLLIAGIVALVAAASRSRPSVAASPNAETPLDILKRRYASGEISREEYEQMRQELQ